MSGTTTAKDTSITTKDNATKQHDVSVTKSSEPTRELSILSSIPHHIQECYERWWGTVPPNDTSLALYTKDKQVTLLKVGDYLKFKSYHGCTWELLMYDFQWDKIITGPHDTDFTTLMELQEVSELAFAKPNQHLAGVWELIPDPLLIQVKFLVHPSQKNISIEPIM